MIVQAAMAMLVLLGLGAFVVDYGVLWVSRAQAQNAADAGAIAGAIARAYDDSIDPPSSFGIVPDSVRKMVFENPVWLDKNAAQADVFYQCPPGANRCVKVEVHRDALPRFFLPVLDIAPQSVRATATAQVGVGNGTKCLKPWAIPDKWNDLIPPSNVFNAYVEGGPGTGNPLSPGDVYSPPVPPGDVGTGFTRATPELALGTTMTLASDVGDPIKPDFLLPLILEGGNTYDQNVAGCNGRLAVIGQTFSVDTSGAPTMEGAVELRNGADRDAMWVGNTIQGSCAPGCAPVSPRLVPIALFDPDYYQLMRANNWLMCPTAGIPCVRVANIVGFFIEDAIGTQAFGHVTMYPSLEYPTRPTLPSESSFLPAISLVR